MKNSTHSKIKNTVILFELLTRQVAADTMKGVDKSHALSIIKEFFKVDSILAKELMLYQALLNEKPLTESKAEYLLSTAIKLRNKLDREKLKEAKYNLIREVKKHYDLQSFFKTSVNNYKVCASIYRIFEGASISKVIEVVHSRSTIVEHLTKKRTGRVDESADVLEYSKQDADVRLLSYKLMIDKFNEKYEGLSTKQKNILKEYINNISNTTTLKDFVIKESKSILTQIKKITPSIKDRVTVIKLKEVCNMLESISKIKNIKENHVLSLLLYHELIKEMKNAK